MAKQNGLCGRVEYINGAVGTMQNPEDMLAEDGWIKPATPIANAAIEKRLLDFLCTFYPSDNA